jgi:hypothetical protein
LAIQHDTDIPGETLNECAKTLETFGNVECDLRARRTGNYYLAVPTVAPLVKLKDPSASPVVSPFDRTHA